MTRFPRILFLLVAAAACAPLVPGQAFAATRPTLPPGFSDEVMVEGLADPVSFAFLPDSRILVNEQRTGRVRLIVGTQLVAAPVVTISDVNAGWERGLLGIAADPAWPERPFVYLLYSSTMGVSRLVRFQAFGDLQNGTSQNLALNSPLVLMEDIPDDHEFHSAGCLRFGPDGCLYVGVGDDVDMCAAQVPGSLKGCILRLDVRRLRIDEPAPVPRALLVPNGNPFSTSDDNVNLVWAYGLRNPWRFHIDPLTRMLYAADVGEGSYEELNEIQAGDNLGWPSREGLFSQPNGCPNPAGTLREPIAWYEHPAGAAAVVSAGVYRPVPVAPGNWPPEYHGDLFYGDYFGGFLRRLKYRYGLWQETSTPGQINETDWGTGFVNPVDFQVGLDGRLWWLSQAPYLDGWGALHRISYRVPVAGVHDGGGEARLEAGPNPFRSEVALTFQLGSVQRARVSIYDVAGRHRRTLFDGVGSGSVRLSWAGEDERGRRLGAGIYLARLVLEGRSETIRLLRVP
jgi:glucose/arabinose dehydrogenase